MLAGLQASFCRGGGAVRVSSGLEHGRQRKLRQQRRRVDNDYLTLTLGALRLRKVATDGHLRCVEPGGVCCGTGAVDIT